MSLNIFQKKKDIDKKNMTRIQT